MGMCVAYGCTRRKKKKNETKADGEKITFHHFPKDEETKEKWVEAIKRENWQPSEHSLICSKHFVESDFDKSSPFRTYLKKEAVPSVFPILNSNSRPYKSQKRKILKKPDRHESPQPEKRNKTELEIDNDSVEVIITEPDIPLADVEEDVREEDPEESPPPSPRAKKPPKSSPRAGDSRLKPPQGPSDPPAAPSLPPRDQYAVFGELVGLQLRDLPSFRVRTIVRQVISTVLFDAAMGKYDDLSTVPRVLRPPQDSTVPNRTPSPSRDFSSPSPPDSNDPKITDIDLSDTLDT